MGHTLGLSINRCGDQCENRDREEKEFLDVCH